ncbi:discoidin domain-containing protein [Aquincola sp. MAHUQ-54]|uniref:Discoidin domain-containing protein n=1 Tax=Aquincola agrisoli TaxID=3119538 RepID=A0AAW9QA42_9BURK
MGAGIALVVAAAAQAAPAVDGWTASASDQVRASVRAGPKGSACLHYDFAGVSGYAVMRRAWPQQWPQDASRTFEIRAHVHGTGGRNDLQFKLADASGDNVWWVNRPDTQPPAAPKAMVIKPRHIEFAWGTRTDRRLLDTAEAEWVVSAGRDGGRGTLCVAGFSRVDLPAPGPAPQPVVQQGDGRLQIDFGQPREFNGLALQWPAAPGDYRVEASADGLRWQTLRELKGSGTGLHTLWLPESETRHLRLRWPPGIGAPTWSLRNAQAWPNRNALLAEQARALLRGDLPRAFHGEQNYWALVGVDGGGERSGLVSEDGAIEVGRGGYSIEPTVLLDDGTRLDASNVEIHHHLPQGHLPMPALQWRHPALRLDIETAADGTARQPTLLARYRLHNPGPAERTVQLWLALRPWQVNPPQQFLTTPGGESRVASLAWRAGRLWVNGAAGPAPTQAPQAVQAAPFDQGLSLQALGAAAALRSTLTDPEGLASALMRFDVTLPAGATRTVGWTAPLGAATNARPIASMRDLDARFDAAAARWHERLNRVRLALPPDAQPLADTLRTSLAHMLMSRDGPRLQPGTRSYARSWVRDGAMMVAALLRMGERDAAQAFVDWYAGHVFASGKVPCCVDRRGADPVVENDSHGQYLYAVAELWRHTHDHALLQRHWPTVRRVTGWIEQQRQQTRGAGFRTPERAHLFGLMPPSISHEGYADKAAYSYWDDFWTLRGLKDAVLIARALGETGRAAAWARGRDEFEHELAASLQASARRYGVPYAVGAADRGDFDATSTTMALNPAQAQAALPAGLLEATFEQYWQQADDRAQGRTPWKDYTPYEWRTVGALLRLGQAERAHAMTRFFMADRRPAGWNQWAEVVLPAYREPRFLGDMPHAWVSSDHIRSVLDMLAFEREPDDTLVIGAGWAAGWLRHPGGVAVSGLSTAHGDLTYRLAPTAAGWTFDLSPLARPPTGGVRLVWPGTGPLPQADAGETALRWAGRELRLPDGTRRLTLTNTGARPEAPAPALTR